MVLLEERAKAMLTEGAAGWLRARGHRGLQNDECSKVQEYVVLDFLGFNGLALASVVMETVGG